jgi:hypothetical protein
MHRCARTKIEPKNEMRFANNSTDVTSEVLTAVIVKTYSEIRCDVVWWNVADVPPKCQLTSII